MIHPGMWQNYPGQPQLPPRNKELPRGLLIIFFTTLITCWVIYALPS